MILVTEDDPDILALVAHQLRVRDHDVVAVELPVQALRLVESGLRPDIAVLDVMMPSMSGFKLIRTLREKPGLANLKAVFMSARTQAEDVAAGKELAHDYLTKPFRVADLMLAVEEALRRPDEPEALPDEAEAEAEGFEPSMGINPNRISSAAP